MLITEIEQKIRGHSPEIIDTKRANAVMIPLIESDDGVCLLFETRSEKVWQPGETCFPGGGIEPGETVRDAAVRECCEELGISRSDIEIIEDFDILTGLGGFVLYSVVGKMNTKYIHLNTEEVADVFTVPLDFFIDTPPLAFDFPLEPQIPKDFDYSVFGVEGLYPWRKSVSRVYSWKYKEHYIWGLTARLVYQFIEKLR